MRDGLYCETDDKARRHMMQACGDRIAYKETVGNGACLKKIKNGKADWSTPPPPFFPPSLALSAAFPSSLSLPTHVELM